MSTPSPPSKRPNVDAVRAYLHHKLRVYLSDGRIVEGTLECFDDSGNMILFCTTEVSHKVNRIHARQTYRMGTVLVPGHVQLRVEALRAQRAEGGGEGGTPLSQMRQLRRELDKEVVKEVEDEKNG